MTTSSFRSLEARLWHTGPSRDVWMILDGARDGSVFSLLLELHLEHSCLYSGILTPEMEIAAPYLVLLDYDYRDTRRLIQQAWGKSWGVFLKSNQRMEALRHHLRTLLVVRDSRGQQMLFRYYDPRVLRVYLPTCTMEELRTVFGPIEFFWTEDEEPLNALEFQLDRTRLLSRSIALGSVGSEP